MAPESFSQPAVLRCARCGRFVDWGHARLQVVCGCKGHLDLPPVFVREGGEADRADALNLFHRDFGHTTIVAFGEVMPLDECPFLVAEMKRDAAGALAYRLLADAFQIVALASDPMWQRAGVAGYLIAEAELMARERTLPRIVVATTNDNLPSLYFYQRRGYQITDVVPGGVLRLLNGDNVEGFAGIPIRDEVRLVKALA